jgi:hypothetical protein
MYKVFSKKIQEFREACYALTGYKIDVLRDKQYRLQSMYAERSTDDLLFEVKHSLDSVSFFHFILVSFLSIRFSFQCSHYILIFYSEQ